MGDIKRVKISSNERGTSADAEYGYSSIIPNVSEILKRLVYGIDAVVSGLDVLATGTPDNYVHLQIGNAIQGARNNGLPIIVDVIQDILIPNNSSAGNPQIDIIEAKYSEVNSDSTTRDIIDPITGVITPTTIYTRSKVVVTIQVKQGTPAGSPAAPTTDAGYTKLAEIYLAAGTGTPTITTGNIKDIDDAASWTTEANLTIRSYVMKTGDTAGGDLTGTYPNPKLLGIIGQINMYGGGSAPTGWLLCDGTSYATGIYPLLFAVIGYNFGGATGIYAVPDFRGIFPKGAGTTNRVAGKDANGNFYAGVRGTYLTDKSQGHRHGPLAPGTDFMSGGAGPTASVPGAFYQYILTTGDPVTDTVNGAPRTGLTTEPQSLGINFIIKHD